MDRHSERNSDRETQEPGDLGEAERPVSTMTEAEAVGGEEDYGALDAVSDDTARYESVEGRQAREAIDYILNTTSRLQFYLPVEIDGEMCMQKCEGEKMKDFLRDMLRQQQENSHPVNRLPYWQYRQADQARSRPVDTPAGNNTTVTEKVADKPSCVPESGSPASCAETTSGIPGDKVDATSTPTSPALSSGVTEKEPASASPDRHECAICLSAFKNGDTVTGLPCTHYFHKRCAKRWMSTRTTCPLCRVDIFGSEASFGQEGWEGPNQRLTVAWSDEPLLPIV